MRPTRKLLTLTATAALFSIMAAIAQELAVPAEPAAPATISPATPVTVPARGSTMETVRAKFGTPSQEQPTVGQPPITRWDYPGYSVFFEHDKVLHTVVVR